MKLIFTSYTSSPEYDQPMEWLKRIEGYTGILESLSRSHTVIGIERISYEGEQVHRGVRYHFTKFPKRNARFPWRMHRFIKEASPDFVFVNGFIFPLPILQLRMVLGKRTKIIVLNRSEKPFKGIKGCLQRFADRYVDAYLFASAEFGELWAGIIKDRRKIHEVLHGSSVFTVSDKPSARLDKAIGGSPVFLWVGRLDANKDPVTVVKGFIRFLTLQPMARLYMIYQTAELLKDIEELIGRSDAASRGIGLVGKISHSGLAGWYNSADFVISGSHFEGGGIAVCEAMSCGCIPLVSNIVSFRKMTGPGKCGLLYEPGNEKALFDVLAQTMEMDIEQERKKTIKQFEEELSFDAIAGKINKLIYSL